MEYLGKIGNWNPLGNKALCLCVSLSLCSVVSWLCIIFLSLQTVSRFCKQSIITGPKGSSLVPKTLRIRILSRVCLYTQCFCQESWYLRQLTDKPKRERRGGMVVIKNLRKVTLGCSLISEGRRIRKQNHQELCPVISCLCFSLYICFALSSLPTHSLLLRPRPPGLEFSVDLLCSHLEKLQLTWRLGFEVGMSGENCLQLKFLLQALKITGK